MGRRWSPGQPHHLVARPGVTDLLCFFLGFLGIHRFYTGYIGLGVLQLITLGGCGIWALIDLICIGLNKYKDAQGQELDEYNNVVGYITIAVAVGFWILNFITRIIAAAVKTGAVIQG